MTNNYVYEFGDSLYLNITNRCPNNCEFCIRNIKDGVSGNDLWLLKEPTFQELADDIALYDLSKYKEIVFCGFGEPTYNLDTLDEVASFLHCLDKTTRINTNGQANLIHGEDVTDVIVTSCDVINVSLNECTAAKYQQHCKSIYGEKAYDALLEFAELCKKRGGKVVF